MAVFTKAKRGTIIKATGLCKKCCSLYDTFSSSFLLNGITNASNTPARVACTPDFKKQYHITIPGSM
jgi:hypothetical protein